MAVSKETLKAMLRDFQGYELSDAELDIIIPDLDGYVAEVENISELDLSDVMSGRLLRAKEGGGP